MRIAVGASLLAGSICLARHDPGLRTGPPGAGQPLNNRSKKRMAFATAFFLDKRVPCGLAGLLLSLICAMSYADDATPRWQGRHNHAHDPGPRPNPASPVPSPVPGLNANES